MNEALWLRCPDPTPLLDYLEGRATERRLRLFACACARRFWGHLRRDRRGREAGEPAERFACREAIETAERFADGLATVDELAAAHEAAMLSQITAPTFDEPAYRAAAAAAAEAVTEAVQGVMETSLHMARREAAYSGVPGLDEQHAVLRAALVETIDQAHLIRHVFGNPFRPVRVDPAWLRWGDGCVEKMIRVVYEERRFTDLPLVADALEDASCEAADLLAHLRASIPHSRGCWAVDALRNPA